MYCKTLSLLATITLLVALAATPLCGQTTRGVNAVSNPADTAARSGASRSSQAAPTNQPQPGGRSRVAQPMAPSWYPLPEKHQQYLDQILEYWEFKSDQIKRYRCVFSRWEYDPVFGPPEKCKTYSTGVIKYSAPDKGLFRVEKMMQYQAPRNPDADPKYAPAEKEMFEHWVCDGHWIYQYDHSRKELIQTELPPEMRGKAIGKGPLPFLFNANAADIKSRFWLRVITPEGAKNEYHLEAVPRTREDAASFKMIHVVIDEQDFLPKAMIVFDRNFSARTPTRTTFEFQDREINFNILAEQLNIFHREFYEPDLPAGWKKEVRKWDQSVAAAGEPKTARNSNEQQVPRR